ITVATPRDMVRLREALRALPPLVEALGDWMPNAEQRNGAMAEMIADQRPTVGDEPGTESESVANAWDDRLLEAEDRPDGPKSKRPEGIQNPKSVSLREQRERQRRPAPRYDDDDLFGEAGWDDEPRQAGLDWGDEPAPDQRPTTNDQRPTTDDRPNNPKSKIQNPKSKIEDGRPSSGLDTCADVLAFLDQALDTDPPALLGASNYLRAEEGGEAPRRTIRPGFDPDMDRVIAASRDAKRWIDQLEARERPRT